MEEWVKLFQVVGGVWEYHGNVIGEGADKDVGKCVREEAKEEVKRDSEEEGRERAALSYASVDREARV